MGRFAESDLSSRDGFIREIFLNFCNSCDDGKIKSFESLNDDETRFRFLASMKCRQSFKVSRNTNSSKNLTLALMFKQKGNQKFQSKQWMTAVEFYNKSLLILPTENGERVRLVRVCLSGRRTFNEFVWILQNKILPFYWQIDRLHFTICRNTIMHCTTLNWPKQIIPLKCCTSWKREMHDAIWPRNIWSERWSRFSEWGISFGKWLIEEIDLKKNKNPFICAEKPSPIWIVQSFRWKNGENWKKMRKLWSKCWRAKSKRKRKWNCRHRWWCRQMPKRSMSRKKYVNRLYSIGRREKVVSPKRHVQSKPAKRSYARSPIVQHCSKSLPNRIAKIASSGKFVGRISVKYSNNNHFGLS